MRTNTNTNTKNNSNINTPIYMKTEKIKNIKYDSIKNETDISKYSQTSFSGIKFSKIIDDNFQNGTIYQDSERNEESMSSFIQRTKAKLRLKIINESLKTKINTIKEKLRRCIQ